MKPFVDWSHMELLRIVDYDLPGILDFEQQVGAARAAVAAGATEGGGQ